MALRALVTDTACAPVQNAYARPGANVDPVSMALKTFIDQGGRRPLADVRCSECEALVFRLLGCLV